MATTPYNLTATWSASNRYTASGDTDVIISNTGSYSIGWTTTASDVAPSILPSEAHPVRPSESRAMTLLDGERLWIVGPGTASLGV